MDEVTLGIDYRLLNLGYGHKVYKHVVAIAYVVATLTWPSVGVKPNTWKSW
jgi:hypothetical protein